ncbi:hypothetical protein CR513_05855, partial [Mucuna pruriens]
MENIMVGNATKVAFILLATLVVIIPCLETSISEFDNFLKAQAEEVYKIVVNVYVPTPEYVINELNHHLGMAEKTLISLVPTYESHQRVAVAVHLSRDLKL